MATHSSTLGWKTPWTEEPGGLQPTGSQRVNTAGRLHFHFLLFMLDSPAREVTNQPHFKEKLCRVAWCNGGRSLQTVRRWGSKQQRVASLLAWKTESRVLRGAPRPRPAEFGIQRTGLGEDRRPRLQPPEDLSPGQEPWLQSCETVKSRCFKSPCHHLLSWK